MGNGAQLVTAPFRCVEGVHQGAIKSGKFFSIAVDSAFLKLCTTLADCEGGVTVIIDDNYIMGLKEHIFAANQEFVEDLLKAGLELQPAKSQCYIVEPFRDAEWDALRGDIPNGMLKNSDSEAATLDGNTLHGITAYSVPAIKASSRAISIRRRPRSPEDLVRYRHC